MNEGGREGARGRAWRDSLPGQVVGRRCRLACRSWPRLFPSLPPCLPACLPACLPSPTAMASSSSSSGGAALNLNAVRETMDVLLEISRILNTGLDMETLSICVRLCEQGINPEALSSVIKELRKATEALKAAENMTS
uniref:Mitotic spindle organizing protein 1 n=2 Tax=Ornithorhynchus anatinus TaxID=9258 RepID=A0A6I8NI67_ORNAN